MGDVAEALRNDRAKARPSGRRLRVLELFGDSPAVLAEIEAMYTERFESCESISAKLLRHSGEYVSEGAVRNYLISVGKYHR